jgi:uncharacterized protein (UPF0335 family)
MARGASAGKKAAANGAGKKAGRKGGSSGAETGAAPHKQAAAAAAEPKKPNQPQPHETTEFLARLTRLKTEAQRVAGEISALGSAVKARGGATYWKTIKRVHDLKKLDPDEARAEVEALVQVAAQVDIRISWMGNQATFADIMEQNQAPAKNTAGSRDLAAARAHSDGYNSGKQGSLPQDNPHSPGTEEYVSWHDGRDEAERDLKTKNPTAAARIAASKTADATLPGETKDGF